MMSINLKFLSVILTGLFILNSYSDECKIDEFKSLYIKLQNELNYENKDAHYDEVKHRIVMSRHNPQEEYGGKIYENSLAREYENSLKKVGAIFDKFKQTPSSFTKSNTELVNFFRNIETNAGHSIETSQFNDVLLQIQKKSSDLFKNSNPSAVITDSDLYLLRKLLIHASDKICSVEASEMRKGKFKNDIEKIKRLPINRLTNFLKKPNQSFKLVDGPKAISQSVEDQLNNLKKWLKNQDSGCLSIIRNKMSGFNNIQECNYKHFFDSVLNNSLTDLESVLHFINANKSRENVAAETDLDINKFQDVHAPEISANNQNKDNGKLCETIRIKSKSTRGKWNCSYTKAIYTELAKVQFKSLFEQDLNKSDLKKLQCPNYNNLSREEKQKFMIVYLAALSKSESDFQPTDSYKEKDGTVSMGMLAIDRRAANKATQVFGEISDGDLEQPELNLKVGLYILKNQLLSSTYRGRLLTGDKKEAYYWSVIHNEDKQLEIINDLESNRSSLPSSCRN